MTRKTVAIIGARLTSSRLPGKQLLPLVGQPIIGHIVNRLRTVPSLDQIIIATTDDPENLALCEWASENGVTPFAWDGDVNDVVGRVDAAVRSVDAGTFVYVCGDCPLIEPATIEHLIRGSSHVSTNGLAVLSPPTKGGSYIHEGFDIFNRGFWNRMVEVAREPFEREHVGAVYHHLKKVEPDEILLVDEDQKYAEINHRLSVDTTQDYAFMTQIYNRWHEQNEANKIVDLEWVIDTLKTQADLIAINAHVHQKAVREVGPKVQILCEAGQNLGLGHLSRSCVAAAALQERLGADVELLIRGKPINFSKLTHIQHKWIDDFDSDFHGSRVVIVDVKNIEPGFTTKLLSLPQSTLKVGVDISSDAKQIFDVVWMPSICVTPELKQQTEGRLHYGLECFLLGQSPVREQTTAPKAAASIVVLTGGADPLGFAGTLPMKLSQIVPANNTITWIQGPYAGAPLWTGCTTKFKTIKSPPSLSNILHEFDYALCIFGVTFFECLRAGVPTVVFDPLGAATDAEWRLLEEMFPSLVAKNLDDALAKLERLQHSGTAALNREITDALAAGPKNFTEMIARELNLQKGGEHAAA